MEAQALAIQMKRLYFAKAGVLEKTKTMTQSK
jgi:hypothetical protein